MVSESDHETSFLEDIAYVTPAVTQRHRKTSNIKVKLKAWS